MRRLVGLVLPVLAGVGGCSAADVVVPAAPEATPSAALRHHVCVTAPSAGAERPAGGLVTVDAQPRSARATWIPGLNQRPCRVVTLDYGIEVATRLAGDIRSAPAFPDGVFSCPADDASRVRLVFSYGAGRAAELAVVSLTGCRAVGAPGARSRRATERLLDDVATVAPQPWAAALRQGAR